MGYYMLDSLAEKAKTFVDSYLQEHPLNQSLDWDAMLSVTAEGTLLHILIYGDNRSFIMESRDFPL